MSDQRAQSFRTHGKVLLEIPVFHQGWELDDTAWVIEHEGRRAIIATNHGGAYFADESFIIEKIAEYKDAISKSRNALELISLPSPTSPPDRRGP